MTRGQGQTSDWVYPNGTLLHLAAQHSSVDMVLLLLEHGADIHASDDLGNTPLHRAVKTGDVKVIGCLLKHRPAEVGRLLSTRNVDDLTALQIAIQLGFEKIRSLFINHLKLSGKNLSNEDRSSAGMLAQHEEELRKVRKRQDKQHRKLQEAEELKAAMRAAVANEEKMQKKSNKGGAGKEPATSEHAFPKQHKK